MTEHVEDGKSRLKIDPPRALANIGYNTILNAEQATSSEDEDQEDRIASDDARRAVGISIGREQTRLTSPITPAVEKAAAIEKEGGYFGQVDGVEETLIEEPENDEDVEDQKTAPLLDTREHVLKTPVPERAPRRTEVSLPSPWRAGTKQNWQTSEKGKSGLLDGLFTRRRAASGPESPLEGWQKLLSNLPSLPAVPRPFSLSSPFSQSGAPKDAGSASGVVQEKSPTASSLASVGVADFNSSVATARPRASTGGRASDIRRRVSVQDPIAARDLLSRPSLHTARSRGAVLRRSTSDQSLSTQRTLSTVESLGDDSRFDNIDAQVNSRLKAIKDSWQDSNIKLPSMSNFNVSQFAPDFFRERSSSLQKRSGGRESLLASGPLLDRNRNKDSRAIDARTRQAYGSTKAALSDAESRKPTSHPHLNSALGQLEGDIVVLGGYRGSILRSAEPPHRQLWVPVKVGLNLRKADLEVGLNKEDDERATEKIVPGGMLSHIGPVDISRRLFKRLRSCEHGRTGRLRVHDYGYDWRLMPSHLSAQLIEFLETLPCNQSDVPNEKRGATVIAHSLGGMIARHAVNQRPDLFSGVVYAGVPNTCVNILGPMRNGDEVLLSNRVLTAQVNFTIRTSFALLPLDGRCFFDKETREEYPVDFFDANTWIDYRLSPCVGRPLPPLSGQPKPSGIAGYVSSMASVLPSLPLPGRKSSTKPVEADESPKPTIASGVGEPGTMNTNPRDRDATGTKNSVDGENDDANASAGTSITIPRQKAIDYLERTLASIKQFKQELDFHAAHAASNVYPPIAVIYGKSTPTVYGAKVNGREAIKHACAYDNLAFASGDGVVLARAAQAPSGYKAARGGIVASDRGHLTLLGDLEAVGKCLNAVIKARRQGVIRKPDIS